VPETYNACVDLLDRHVEEGRGDRIAIRTPLDGRSLTYHQVLREVEAVAAGLRAHGVEPEQRVALVLLDSVEYVAAFLGALRIGAVPVSINPLLPARDVAVIVADARARVALVASERFDVDSTATLSRGAPELVTVVGTADWPSAFPLDAATGGAVPRRVAAAPYATWDESPGFWLCTSGSTGQPKLAMHRHADLVQPARHYAREVLDITPDDVFWSIGPAFHAYGLGNSISFPFSVGATTVLVPTRPPTPALVAEVMAAARPTLFFTVPTFTAALCAADLAADTFASVRLGVSAAEALPAEIYQRFLDRFGVTVLDGIGSTELTHIYCSNRPGPGGTRPGTSGKPVGGYTLRLVDDAGSEVADAVAGHLLVAGDTLATGYWCRTEQNRRAFQGAHLRTGDMYERSADGFYTYLGRSDDMLRVGGEWVSPTEVEGVLVEHPAVLEAAVVGERDDAGALRPIAFVVCGTGARAGTADDPHPLVELLDAHCRQRLAGYKRPRAYRIVESLPKTATGKIQRFKLRGPD
jgi:benzoate-CoA ligase family protein